MIRKLKADDIKSVVEIENSTLGDSLGESMLLGYVDNQYCISYVVEIDSRVIGYISCNFDGYNLEICNICIAKEYQNQGLGTKLLSYALDEASTKEAITAIIDVKDSNLRAIHVYEKLGFKQINIRKNYYKTGEDAIVMQKLFN